MSTFKKFPEIDNSYQAKNISRWLERNPNLRDILYVSQLKLDGSNICFIFKPTGEMFLASRNNIITPHDSFFDVWNVIKRPIYKDWIDFMISHAQHERMLYHVYGELFGPGVQKRINYGDEKKILFFDVREDEHLIAPYNVYNDGIIPENLLVPILHLHENLEDALALNEVFVDPLSPTGDEAEGAVIKPWKTVEVSPVGETFFLKKKSPKFSEKMKTKAKEKKEPKDNPFAHLEDLHLDFLSYINMNRVYSAFSKNGRMEKMSQMGEYIRIILEDAKKDFIKDNELGTLDKKEAKYIFNPGDRIAKLLIESLQEA